VKIPGNFNPSIYGTFFEKFPIFLFSYKFDKLSIFEPVQKIPQNRFNFSSKFKRNFQKNPAFSNPNKKENLWHYLFSNLMFSTKKNEI
jgi:hypothetical protein